MNNNSFNLAYRDRGTWLDRASGATKLLAFIFLSGISMIVLDTRFLIFLVILSLIVLKISRVKFSEVSFLIKLVVFFMIINLLMIYVLAPGYGAQLYHSKDIIFGSGPYALTKQELLYLVNISLEYFVAVPLALIFLLTTNPSEFASGLNRIGISYKISYAVSLALRYIPDVTKEYQQISLSQQARGNEISKKAGFFKRLRGAAAILVPLLLSSIDRIESVSQAMELRRFGAKKKRSWYFAEQLKAVDWLVLFIVLLIMIGGVILLVVNGGRFWNPFIH
ncbi:energy-coupling factor transporter transmembrane component T family protein [Oenococcus oeni]|uniref:ABC-type cobalt transport system, permease component CbiQ-like transporter n=4 Tax=Oenococcus oeni TaxID=1247 RepID=Q04DS6_OENOB|nr:energy-coupling factor transporter transmembrane component T [Oenococcus oeni]EAV39032.1 ABC-type cobalt transport system, permease component CbiQ [Oenococcus oeni ATCC BAA-1163]MDI4583644.1 energy-coupling factor transporter transmembrane protein EcfT [Oenococcus sp. UCMA 14587]ABJ57396.1 ABC-type cobalt transport system, permease component CbiQ-like transporter [Oenococcus oeni PSU-1]AVI94694.1 hypothetical protein AX764_07670 [Oenococcus oeni]AWW99073.1 energy-coupling factor transporter